MNLYNLVKCCSLFRKRQNSIKSFRCLCQNPFKSHPKWMNGTIYHPFYSLRDVLYISHHPACFTCVLTGFPARKSEVDRRNKLNCENWKRCRSISRKAQVVRNTRWKISWDILKAVNAAARKYDGRKRCWEYLKRKLVLHVGCTSCPYGNFLALYMKMWIGHNWKIGVRCKLSFRCAASVLVGGLEVILTSCASESASRTSCTSPNVNWFCECCWPDCIAVCGCG